MDPSESDEFPDLILSLDTYKAEFYNEIMLGLNRGQEIGFNATIKSFGSEMQSRHFHLRNIWKEDGFKEIPLQFVHSGRYADRPRFFRSQKPGVQLKDKSNDDKSNDKSNDDKSNDKSNDKSKDKSKDESQEKSKDQK